jgi:translocation and assembly module TamA
VVEDLSSSDFATARISASRVEVDVPEQRARVELSVDSGPAYTLGTLRIEGLTRYPATVVESLNPLWPGQPYERALINEFVLRLQGSSFLTGVSVAPQFDPEHPELTPVLVTVSESQRRRLSVGLGYASDTGAHLEVLYRQAMVFDRPWILQTGARIDQTGGYGYADLFFPLRGGVWRDAVGVLFDDNDIENQRVRRSSAAASTTRLLGARDGRNHETTYTLNFENEKRTIPDAEPIRINTLSASVNWVYRNVDSVINPRSGQLLQLQGNLGLSGVSLGDGFERAYGRVVQFLPVGGKDVLVLRAELGYVNAKSTANVPNRYLFRTGGATSVRGYDFQSLGVDENGAVVGGRALAVGSVEYVHWISDWGVAAFVDVGDAAARPRDLSPAWGYGLGARLRTPAGPFAVDVAYGERFQQVRVQFAVTLAF